MTTAAAADPGLTIDETIRQTVRALRSARRVDALVLARALGISRQSLYNRLNGAAPFLAAEIAGLATFFGVPIIDFYEGVVRVGAAPTNGHDHATVSERYQAISGQVVPLFAQVRANGRKNRRSRLGHLAELGQVSELRPSA